MPRSHHPPRPCRTPEIATAMDADPDNPQYIVKQKSVVCFHDSGAHCLTLGELLQVVHDTHRANPLYKVTESNCIWFVRAVLQRLVGLGKATPQGVDVFKEFAGHRRTMVGTRVSVLLGAAEHLNDLTAASQQQ